MEKVDAKLQDLEENEKARVARTYRKPKLLMGDIELSPESARRLQEWEAREGLAKRSRDGTTKVARTVALDPGELASLIPAQRRSGKRLVAYYRELGVKYERAARYPWLPVEPDPPEPPMPN
jgi:hypothetical protein